MVNWNTTFVLAIVSGCNHFGKRLRLHVQHNRQQPHHRATHAFHLDLETVLLKMTAFSLFFVFFFFFFFLLSRSPVFCYLFICFLSRSPLSRSREATQFLRKKAFQIKDRFGEYLGGVLIHESPKNVGFVFFFCFVYLWWCCCRRSSSTYLFCMWYLFVWLLVVLLLICIHKADNVCVDVFVDIDTCQLNSTTPFVVVAFALTLLLLNDVVYLLFGFKPPTHTSKLLNKLRQKKSFGIPLVFSLLLFCCKFPRVYIWYGTRYEDYVSLQTLSHREEKSYSKFETIALKNGSQ